MGEATLDEVMREHLASWHLTCDHVTYRETPNFPKVEMERRELEAIQLSVSTMEGSLILF